jgi:Tol biopolymer transport system component
MSKKFLETSTSEETSLNLSMVNEPTQIVVGSQLDFKKRSLIVSPDGEQLVHLSSITGKNTIVVRDISNKNNFSQRTSRKSSCPYLGVDGNIYFSDMESYQPAISSVNSEKGTIIRQYTNGSMDYNPFLTQDGKKLFFERRYSGSNDADIWCIDLKTNVTTLCCKGEYPVPIDKAGTKIMCVRNNAIWVVDYIAGKESLILNRSDMRFYTPSISYDGNWILCSGYSITDNNFDIYVVRADGSDFTRLTYHSGNDLFPVWSKDGKSIYFISNRANSQRKYNIWKLYFPL